MNPGELALSTPNTIVSKCFGRKDTYENIKDKEILFIVSSCSFTKGVIKSYKCCYFITPTTIGWESQRFISKLQT